MEEAMRYLAMIPLVVAMAVIISLLMLGCAHRPCNQDEWLVRQDCK